MGIRIVELFGYDPEDQSADARAARKHLFCPFANARCRKTLNDGTVSGVCTMRQAKSDASIVTCPVRLYDDKYRILLDVAASAFGNGTRLMTAEAYAGQRPKSQVAVAFGKGSGKEVKLPQVSGRGGFFVDWVLALVAANGSLVEFVAVEVQSIDTTGNYRKEREALLDGRPYTGFSKGGINWENVSKRIIPQVIYKGHVLRREPLCKGGLFFVCPTPVYARIRARLSTNLAEYRLQPGTITFKWYGLGRRTGEGSTRQLEHGGEFTTTVDQVALAFTAPVGLPHAGVYEEAIRKQLQDVQNAAF